LSTKTFIECIKEAQYISKDHDALRMDVCQGLIELWPKAENRYCIFDGTNAINIWHVTFNNALQYVQQPISTSAISTES